jgi:hypothetical protein
VSARAAILIVWAAGLIGFTAPAPAAGADLGRVIERAIGRQVSRSLEAEYGLVQDPVLTEWVSSIGNRLEVAGDREPADCEFKILDAGFVNAMAVPDGTVFVTRGLLQTLDSEDELALLLGHEITHIAERHTLDQLEKTAIAELLLSTLRSPEKRDLKRGLGVLGGLVLLRYSREDESEADLQGLSRIGELGYDPRVGVGFLHKLAQIEGAPPSRLESYLQTHPRIPDRISAIEKRGEYESTADNLARWGREYAARGLPAQAYEALTQARDGGASGLDELIDDLESRLPDSVPVEPGRVEDRRPQDDGSESIADLASACTRDLRLFASLDEQAVRFGEPYADRVAAAFLISADFQDAVADLDGAAQALAAWSGEEDVSELDREIAACTGRTRGDLAAFSSVLAQFDRFVRAPGRSDDDLRQFDGLFAISRQKAQARRAESREILEKARRTAVRGLVGRLDALGEALPEGRGVLAHYLHAAAQQIPAEPLGRAAVIAIGSRIEAEDRARKPIPGQDPVSWAEERGADVDALGIILRFVESDLEREAAALRRIHGPADTPNGTQAHDDPSTAR